MIVSPAKQPTLLQNALAAIKMPDIQKRLQFVALAFFIYALGSHIPVPGVDAAKIQSFFQTGAGAGAFFGLLNMFTGGALQNFSIFALGVIPYINGSIMIQLLTSAIPQLEQLRKEGEWGRRKLARYTRWATLISAVLQGWGFLHLFIYSGAVPETLTFLQKVRIVLSTTAGTAFLMWLGELITNKGIGQGISLIIFAGIVMRLPAELFSVLYNAFQGGVPAENVILLFSFFFLTLVFVVFVQQSQRRIPVNYTRRMVGNRMGKVSSYLPIPVNIGGVIPIIFALAVVSFPITVLSFFPPGVRIPLINIEMQEVRRVLEAYFTPGGGVVGLILYGLVVVAFTYFYAAIVFRSDEVSDNLRKYGGVIPGIRPGSQTTEYIDRVATRITFAGAVFLAVIAVLEFLVPKWTQIREFELVGGTSILIAVSVALETMKQLEAQHLLRQYETFIK
ncbi:MAG: preprotein translocase subunit SecY [Armatimonadetes bacterium]|nr:preprotein translocase subunit SecY [Armatimonadota bacterium]MDW8121179.1 preprotein translocase subunit SecY [Armatimonadota bacterium]